MIRTRHLSSIGKNTLLPPISTREYLIDGKKYVVTRHFTGNKDINKVIREIAVARANREMNINY